MISTLSPKISKKANLKGHSQSLQKLIRIKRRSYSSLLSWSWLGKLAGFSHLKSPSISGSEKKVQLP